MLQSYLLRLKEILPLRTKLIFVLLTYNARELIVNACEFLLGYDPE